MVASKKTKPKDQKPMDQKQLEDPNDDPEPLIDKQRRAVQLNKLLQATNIIGQVCGEIYKDPRWARRCARWAERSASSVTWKNVHRSLDEVYSNLCILHCDLNDMH